MGALSGIKVVDLSLFLPGPMLTVMMADQGANVVKVEPPSGDPARTMPPISAGQSVWFRQVNRGKKSVALDLKQEAGRRRLLELVHDADVFVEGFRPGVMKRLGFDYQRLSKVNPRLVYCSISAFGQNGSMAEHPAHDLVVQALTGFLSVNDKGDGEPVVPAVPSADMAAGLTGLSAVLMALVARERTGRGDYVDVSMFSSLLPWCAHVAGDAIEGGEPPRSATQRSLGGAAFYRPYRTADGLYVVLGGREEKFVQALLEALGRSDLIDAALGPAGEQGEVISFLEQTFATRTRADWETWFHDRDVAFAPVLDFTEALSSPYVREQGLVRGDAGKRQIAPAIAFANQSDWAPSEPPELAQ
jgi:crotonobetainyl-CoA:carnitine CoA-transferase CaiB-like acyl-CoA transferase